MLWSLLRRYKFLASQNQLKLFPVLLEMFAEEEEFVCMESLYGALMCTI